MATRLARLSPRPSLLTGISDGPGRYTILTAEGWKQTGNGFLHPPGRWVLIPIDSTVSAWRWDEASGEPVWRYQQIMLITRPVGERTFVQFDDDAGTQVQVLAIPC